MDGTYIGIVIADATETEAAEGVTVSLAPFEDGLTGKLTFGAKLFGADNVVNSSIALASSIALVASAVVLMN